MVKKPDHESVWKEYDKGIRFNSTLDLYETVRTNENFFIGKQWEGVEANGLPTPVFNFLKRVVLFTVASITSNSVKINAVPFMGGASNPDVDKLFRMVNREFERLFEINKITELLREFLRNAAVDGDCATYTYWDDSIDTGNPIKGAIITEIIENTRVLFGNVNDRRVQRQPYIIIVSRNMIDEVQAKAKKNGFSDWESISTDTDDRNINSEKHTDDKVTVLTKLWKNKETGTIWAYECTQKCGVRKPWDTGLTLYPITWLCWDYVHDNYHGQAMITGLIPNQIFVNKLFAMSMISLMTTAYPKVIYDKTRVNKWDNRVGAAIGVNGGDVQQVARTLESSTISPQIAQFIELAIEMTQANLGATSVALGDTRPDNTSAIIALQKAAATPNELTRQNLYQSLEDLGRIYIDFISENYGTREIEEEVPKEAEEAAAEFNLPKKIAEQYDFGELKGKYYSIKLDVGAAALWSETAAMQTLDNLLMQQMISAADYIERVPEGLDKRPTGIAQQNERLTAIGCAGRRGDEYRTGDSARLPASLTNTNYKGRFSITTGSQKRSR